MKRRCTTSGGVLALCLFFLYLWGVFGFDVSGRVVDVETGKPVAGAYVFASSGHDEWCPFEAGGCWCDTLSAGLTRTDANGYYHFDQRFYVGLTPTSKVGDVTVYKPGYVTAPEMVAEGRNESSGKYIPTPEEYVARQIPPQYFYGTGDYRDSYHKYPLNWKSDTYYLSSRSVSELRDFPDDVTPRVLYLYNIVTDFEGACEYKNINRVKLLFPLKRAIYEEAAPLARTKKDFTLLNRICNIARGLNFFGREPCHIGKGPVVGQGDKDE